MLGLFNLGLTELVILAVMFGAGALAALVALVVVLVVGRGANRPPEPPDDPESDTPAPRPRDWPG